MIGDPFYNDGENEEYILSDIIKGIDKKLIDISVPAPEGMSRKVPSEDISELSSQKSILPLPPSPLPPLPLQSPEEIIQSPLQSPEEIIQSPLQSPPLQSPEEIIQSPLDKIKKIVKNIPLPSAVDVLTEEEKQIPSLKLRKTLHQIWTIEHNHPSNQTTNDHHSDITSNGNIGSDKEIKEILASPSNMPKPARLIVEEPMTMIMDDSNYKDGETQTDGAIPLRRKRNRSSDPKSPGRVPIKMPMISPISPRPMPSIPPTIPSFQGSTMIPIDKIGTSKMYISEIIMNSTADQPSLYYFKKLAIMTILNLDIFGDIISNFAERLPFPRDSVIKSTEEVHHVNMYGMQNEKSNSTSHTVPICPSESEDKDGEPNRPK